MTIDRDDTIDAKVVAKGILLFVSAAIVYYGWNYFFTDLFGLRAIGYWEAFFLRIFIQCLTRPTTVYTKEEK